MDAPYGEAAAQGLKLINTLVQEDSQREKLDAILEEHSGRCSRFLDALLSGNDGAVNSAFDGLPSPGYSIDANVRQRLRFNIDGTVNAVAGVTRYKLFQWYVALDYGRALNEMLNVVQTTNKR